MKIFASSQIKEIDKLTIEREPVSSILLMERASMQFTSWFTSHFDSSNPVVVFAGSGNNGGDALAISRMLIEKQYQVKVFLIYTSDGLSHDCAFNLEKLKNYIQPVILKPGKLKSLPVTNPAEIIIDGIFGSGLSRTIEEPVGKIIRHINQHTGIVVSIDIPSGLFGEDNRKNIHDNIIKASYTVSFEFPFLSFFISENEKYTGKWSVIPIGLHKETIEKLETQYETLETCKIKELLIPRNKFSHKGTYGNALIIAGKYGMMGAAVLSAKACLRGGAGLTTLCIPGCCNNIIQTAVPEALIVQGNSDEYFTELPDLSPYRAIACGPAIGRSDLTALALHSLILKSKVPLVLDADALSILSEHPDWLKDLPPSSVITPHPAEFDRLTDRSEDMYSRHVKQLDFAKRYKVIVVLKGAHTIVTAPDGKSFINASGNPGMATGGTGDVLTGLLVSLITQGYSSLDASLIAVYIHGMAGDIALEYSSMEALIASDIIDNLGMAFRRVKGRG
jgi:NAD(P)H-hydrate epimerase